ncbi:hypothetical protein GGS24DRAFT_517892 [Hypoxylon argillaceum]|nr:hypothetical protein GGS24DRAFT_517892 [Hypoxylon argillaceum]
MNSYANSKALELPQNPSEQPSDALLPYMKRALDVTFDMDQLPPKRDWLTRREGPQPGIEKEEQRDKITLQQPEPRHPKRLYTSFLKDFVDLVHPHSHPDSLDPFVSEWVDAVESREKLCRSDSHVYRSSVDPVSRHLTRSAPEIGYTKETDEFLAPLTPLFTKSQSYPSSTASSSSSIRHRVYRQNNLQFNHIHVRRADALLPSIVSSSVNSTLHAKRDSPEPSAEETKVAMDWLETLAEGCDEGDVAAFLSRTIFPNPNDRAYGATAGLISNAGAPILQHLVPIDHTSRYRVAQPKPDKLYGYPGIVDRAFTEPQLLAQTMLDAQTPHYPGATPQGLRFPFLSIEVKAAGGTRGDLWVATNQCAGASAACLNAIGQVNESLRDCQRLERVDNLCYTIAMDNNTAHLYVSWIGDDLNYYLQRVNVFLLLRPEDLNSFRMQIRNILDWGKSTRLNQIRDALDFIFHERRKNAREAAKSRSSPSVDSVTSIRKKRKLSSSSRNSGRAGSV